MKCLRQGRWGILILLAVVASGVAWVLLSRETPGPPIIVLRAPARFPPARGSVWRFVPRSWSWLWRFRQALVGRVATVNLQPMIVAFPDLADLAGSALALGPPEFSGTNGVELWRLPQSELMRLKQLAQDLSGAELLTSSRIITGNGSQASLFMGQTLVIAGITNNVGVAVDCLPRVLPSETELTTAITMTDTITNFPTALGGTNSMAVVVLTNLDVSAKVRLPSGQGLFLLDSKPTSQGRRMGVILPVQVPPKK